MLLIPQGREDALLPLTPTGSVGCAGGGRRVEGEPGHAPHGRQERAFGAHAVGKKDRLRSGCQAFESVRRTSRTSALTVQW